MKYRFDEIAFNSTVKKTPGESDKTHYIGLEHIDSECLEITRWGSDVAPIGDKLIMKKGDILFGKRRAYQRKLAIAPFDGIFSAHGMVLRPKEEVVDKNYFPFFMSSDLFMERAVQISVGGLSPTINWKDLREQEFSLPPLAEQKVLADKLWAAYRLKESYKKLLAATEDMVKSQFIEMFFKNTWKEKYLEDVVSEDCSLSYGIVQPGEGVEDGIPVVRPVDLVSDIVEPDYLKKTTLDIANSYKRTTLKGGELLLCVRGTTGLLSMASNRLNGGNVTRGIVPIWFKKEISKAFMFHQMKSDYVQTQIKENTYGTTLLQINIKDLRKIKVILPPEDLQQKFVTIAEEADKSVFELRKSIDAIDAVIKSLINS